MIFRGMMGLRAGTLAALGLCWLAISAAVAETRSIAITIDDAPRRDSAYFDGPTRTTKLLATLAAAQIPQVVFFCNSAAMDASGAARIKSYGEAGHLIANHTHTHADLDRVGAEAFIAEVDTADRVLKSFPNYRPWLRFPYLHEGKSIEARDAVRSALKQRQYLSAYVTIDTFDWHMDSMFQEAVKAGKTISFERLRSAYVEVLSEGIEFYDRIARESLGRSPRHVLLMHENDLAVLYLGDLVAKLRSSGWKIVSPEEAFRDPIASVEPSTLTLGQGRVIAMAIDKGYTGPRRLWEDMGKLQAEFERRRVWE